MFPVLYQGLQGGRKSSLRPCNFLGSCLTKKSRQGSTLLLHSMKRNENNDDKKTVPPITGQVDTKTVNALLKNEKNNYKSLPMIEGSKNLT